MISFVDRARKDTAWWRESDLDGQAVSSDVQAILDLGVSWLESCHQRYVSMTLSVINPWNRLPNQSTGVSGCDLPLLVPYKLLQEQSPKDRHDPRKGFRHCC